MTIQEHFPIKAKTTMRIGGTARWYAQLQTTDDVEEAVRFAAEKNVPLVVLGSGSNTVFADGEVQAVVVQVMHDTLRRDVAAAGNRATLSVGCGKNLPMLINELAPQGLDLSPLTGIPGTVGGAIVGNAGQGPKGVWMDAFIESVTVFMGGQWRTLTREECAFEYRESAFKERSPCGPIILWEATLSVPQREPTEIASMIESLLKTRIDTQPHAKTAGSCFKAIGAMPAWQLIDAAGLRGKKIGGVEIAQKHTNFLLNTGQATYADAKAMVELVRTSVISPLEVEMRFVEPDGSLAF